jgi:hypothetical protein
MIGPLTGGAGDAARKSRAVPLTLNVNLCFFNPVDSLGSPAVIHLNVFNAQCTKH